VILPADQIALLKRGELGEVVLQSGHPEVGSLHWVRRSLRDFSPAVRARVVDVWTLHAGGWAVLLERAEPEAVRGEAVPFERPRLRLSRTQRAKLFGGEAPHIGGEGKPPVEAGETVRLSARVALTVLRVDAKAGKWRLHYELKDSRDPVRLLRRTPPAHREGDELDIGQEGAVKEAARQSFYTADASAAVADAGEAPDREWVAVRTKTQREFDHQRRLARHAEEMRQKSKSRRKRAA
jgi:hypothetical protein